MSAESVRYFLLWSTVINLALLLWWNLLMLMPHAWMYRFWGRWFRLSAEQFDAINAAGIVLYKIGIILFNLVPYVALLIVG
jgi:hypothetical protein